MTQDRPTITDQIADEFDEALDAAASVQELIEPSADEKRNGWTAETLSDYIASREAAASLAIDPHSLSRRLARRPREAYHRYRPLRWR